MDNITNELIAAIGRFYQPAATLQEATELKTTLDLLNEFTEFSENTKQQIFDAMKAAGYKIEYTGMGFAWLMKQVNS